jgi:hypothetical protein
MIKRTMIATGVALAITTTLTANIALAEEESSFMDELEISGELKNESAVFTKSGQTIGQATSTTDTTTNNSSGDLYKSENTARFFINGDVGEEGSSFHAELNLKYDTEATDGYKGAKSYSQHDLLRELYVDTEVGNEDNPISIRAGKQQVVWGTADGIKLLDIINPTDWREMAQNSMEDSRIPVWMLNAETDLESGGNLQFILSQAEENKIAGLNASGDQGGPFVMKGVDTITGKTNGFLNVAPALAAVATTFHQASVGAGGVGGFQQMPTSLSGITNGSSTSLVPFTGFTVDGFAGNSVAIAGGFDNVSSAGQMISNGQTGAGVAGSATNGAAYAGGSATDGINLLYGMAQNGGFVGSTLANNNITNLVDTTWGIATPTSAFEYMPNSTFSTFNSLSGAGSEYIVDNDAQDKANFGFRFKDSTEGGTNYSFNFFQHEDANPYIQMDWVDQSSGEVLAVELRQGGDANGMPLGGTLVSRANVQKDLVSYGACVTAGNCVAVAAAMQPYVNGNATNATTVLLKDSNNNYYGAMNPNTGAANNALYTDPILRMTEKSNTVSSIGASVDSAVETEEFGSVILRGEFLYNHDEMTPIVNKKLLAIGDLTGALTMKKGDVFKYVLGADVTVLTNLMLSAQFIQFRNLDYVDEKCTGTTQMGSAYDCSTYTGDQATMHLTNQMNKAEENKEFYSFFMSKPFGAEQQHRWNNIFMFEENGGKWNRADVEYSFSDEIIGSAEYNKYWGDENTQFGQLEKSSNFQLGLKYIF